MLILLSACKDKSFVLEGRLMKDCDTPEANMEMFLKRNYLLKQKGGEIISEFKSDENGYFRALYVRKNRTNLRLGVHYDDKNHMVLNYIPNNENLNLGNVYYFPITTSIIIHLDVKNSYTSNDTLLYRNYDYSEYPSLEKRKAGPFQSGVLDTMNNVNQMNFPQSYNDSTYELSIRYHIEGQDYKDQYFDVEVCGDEYNHVTLTIE